MERLPDSTSLGTVRSILREKWDEGLTCPCCQQHVQRYSRPITSAMAAGLILFYYQQIRNPETQWIHAEEFFKEKRGLPSSIRGDFSKLRFWGLIQANDESEGYYRVTDKGMDFVKLSAKVESHVMLYNNKSYGFKGHYVDIQWCLKKKFDYIKLLNGTL